MHDQIAHVIVLTLENRSFDHMLGCLQAPVPTLDGIDPKLPPRTNFDGPDRFEQVAGAARVLTNDPMHETSDVLAQIKQNNSGFVLSYAAHYPSSTLAERGEIMKFHALDALPALHFLARNFTICDHWFASVPGPTWANRLFLMSGTSLGRVKMANGIMDLHLHWYDQITLFDRLDERGVDWKVYYGDASLSLLLVHQWEPENAARHSPMRQFFLDVAGDEAKFPKFAFIEPSYLSPGANDDHPPHDVLQSEALIASVYNALRANAKIWESCLFVVVFDEHGGFYDHVAPPDAVPPDLHQEEYSFNRLGVRVPALLISPLVNAGVCSTVFDHTSLLKFAVEKWDLGPLGNRTAQANSIGPVLQNQARSMPSTPINPLPQNLPPVTPPVVTRLNDHQAALFALSHLLETIGDADPSVMAARARYAMSGVQSQIDTITDRVDEFLAKSRAKIRAKI